MSEGHLDVAQDSPGRVLAKHRDQRGWSIADVAGQLNLAPRQVLAIEEGRDAALPTLAIRRGFITRHTAEMNMDKVESVDVDQSMLGRMLGYGTIHVLGTGQGIESLRLIAAPLALRNAITAK